MRIARAIQMKSNDESRQKIPRDPNGLSLFNPPKAALENHSYPDQKYLNTASRSCLHYGEKNKATSLLLVMAER